MYRYDALGRRVQTHSVRGSACASTETECASYFERTVWDGDQVLYEIRTPESLPWTDNPASGTYHAFGRVVYLHGGGLDAPLAITRMDLSGQPAEVTVAPHADWQRHFVGGSLMSGASQAPCTGASGCPLIDWPGGKMTTDGVLPTPVIRAWWGRFLQGQTDGSGLRYQRNRFYDPLTGQFTQQDPIGLAGGINLYAFAGGDRVNFRDPFGLWPLPCCIQLRVVTGAAREYSEEQWERTMAIAMSGTPLGIVGVTQKVGTSLAARVLERGKAPEWLRGTISESEFLSAAARFLGEAYREVSPGRFVSKAGDRQVRFGPHKVNCKQLHGHFEAKADGRVIENARVNIRPDHRWTITGGCIRFDFQISTEPQVVQSIDKELNRSRKSRSWQLSVLSAPKVTISSISMPPVMSLRIPCMTLLKKQ